MIDLNELAIEITKREGKEQEVNIAQVKEVLKVTLGLIAQKSDVEVIELLQKYREE